VGALFILIPLLCLAGKRPGSSPDPALATLLGAAADCGPSIIAAGLVTLAIGRATAAIIDAITSLRSSE